LSTDHQNAAAEPDRILREFVRAAVSHVATALNGRADEFPMQIPIWNRGDDGNFRPSAKQSWTLSRVLSDDLLRSLPNYEGCVRTLESHPLIGHQLNQTVGTCCGALRQDVDRILQSLVYAMLDDDGRIEFADTHFDREWAEIVAFLAADQFKHTVIAPIPYLHVPEYPLRLNEQLEIDRLTDDEVTRCIEVGVLRSVSTRFPLLFHDIAVGARKTVYLPKLIGGIAPSSDDGTDEDGFFGRRSIFGDHLVVGDVLSALRLFKSTRIRAAGSASWVDCSRSGSATTYRELGRWPYGEHFDLHEADLLEFLDLWQQLEKGSPNVHFSIHRFNLAFDRGLTVDKIVDLVIAAESLLLQDSDTEYRGEVRFRFSLRAASFIEHPTMAKNDVYRFMKGAYDARSAIVHGGSPKKSVDTKTLEELVRLGLRKALAMKADATRLRQSAFWDDQLWSSAG